MKALRGDELLALPLRLNGIKLGRPVDLLLDRDELRVLGVEVSCRNRSHRFLPFPAARIDNGTLSVSSPLVLLEEDELAFYSARALRLSSLRGRPVTQNGRPLGLLADVVIDRTGTVVELVVSRDGDERPVPYGDSVRLPSERRSVA
jgi:sporulation protein YlmC with PRC-barrel domain